MGKDVKRKEEKLTWMGIDCGKVWIAGNIKKKLAIQTISLWNAPIFPVMSTREESLHALLQQIQSQKLFEGDQISLDRLIFHETDVEANLVFREEIKNKK